MSKEDKFWKWFAENEDALFGFDPNDVATREVLFDKLQSKLHQVHRGLAFEFSPPGEATREFVISADGMKDVFRAVVSLSKSAPSLSRWKITAFRPRRSPIMPIEIGTSKIDPSELQFTLLHDGRNVGIQIFIPGVQEGELVWQQIGYLMLDQALGEFDVETRLGLIKILAPESHTDGVRHPFVELPTRFDQLISILEGRSAQPS
ncbi:MAG TPA: hypothetical protein VMH23_15015 [Bacteroidota bacterium]|nr:hypothetical protein [Bacteroidota bacterium]